MHLLSRVTARKRKRNQVESLVEHGALIEKRQTVWDDVKGPGHDPRVTWQDDVNPCSHWNCTITYSSPRFDLYGVLRMARGLKQHKQVALDFFPHLRPYLLVRRRSMSILTHLLRTLRAAFWSMDTSF